MNERTFLKIHFVFLYQDQRWIIPAISNVFPTGTCFIQKIYAPSASLVKGGGIYFFNETSSCGFSTDTSPVMYNNINFIKYILDVIKSCKINEIPGFGMALTLCGIFPPRSSGGCITHGGSLTTGKCCIIICYSAIRQGI